MESVKPRYVVYNTFTRLNGGLRAILTKSPVTFELKNEKIVIGIDSYYNTLNTFCEIKVSWTSEEEYLQWQTNISTEYQQKRNILEQYYIENSVQFQRYTNLNDNYKSERIDAPSLISNIRLNKSEENFFIKHILPLGTKTEYAGEGKFKNGNPIYSSRFLKERSSKIIRRSPSPDEIFQKTLPNFLFAYSLECAIDFALYDCQTLWEKIKKLCLDVELFAESLLLSCSNSAIIIGHSSLGKGLVLHTHRLDHKLRPTVTICKRLSYNSKQPTKLNFYDALNSQDPDLSSYYVNLDELKKKVYTGKATDVDLVDDTCVFIFNGSFLPHSTIWSDDLYIFFVYDGAELIPETMSKFKAQAKYFFENPENKNGYCYLI